MKPAEKGGDVCQALLCCAPENRMLLRIWYLKRFLGPKPEQSVVARQPIFRKHADVDVNANGCAWYADGIRTVLQDVRNREHLFFFAGQRQGATSDLFRRCDPFAFTEQKDGVDRIRIVDVIGRDARGIGSTARLCEKHLVKESAFFDVAGEHLSLVDILIADRGGQIFPARVFWIERRITRVRRDVAGPARYADAIRTDEFVV